MIRELKNSFYKGDFVLDVQSAKVVKLTSSTSEKDFAERLKKQTNNKNVCLIY